MFSGCTLDGIGFEILRTPFIWSMVLGKRWRTPNLPTPVGLENSFFPWKSPCWGMPHIPFPSIASGFQVIGMCTSSTAGGEQADVAVLNRAMLLTKVPSSWGPFAATLKVFSPYWLKGYRVEGTTKTWMQQHQKCGRSGENGDINPFLTWSLI